jgi:mRNA interferase HigB
MHVISQRTLRLFWERHPTTESSLRAWYHVVRKADWRHPDDIKNTFGRRVDQYRQFTIFDIGGNKCRLIAVVNFQNRRLFVRGVLTHPEYDRGDWKKDKFNVKRFGKGSK